jgi:hypothetical protein
MKKIRAIARDLGRVFFWLNTIRSIRIDSREEIDTIFRYVASALHRFSIRYSIHCYVRATFYVLRAYAYHVDAALHALLLLPCCLLLIRT